MFEIQWVLGDFAFLGAKENRSVSGFWKILNFDGGSTRLKTSASSPTSRRPYLRVKKRKALSRPVLTVSAIIYMNRVVAYLPGAENQHECFKNHRFWPFHRMLRHMSMRRTLTAPNYLDITPISERRSQLACRAGLLTSQGRTHRSVWRRKRHDESEGGGLQRKESAPPLALSLCSSHFLSCSCLRWSTLLSNRWESIIFLLSFVKN